MRVHKDLQDFAHKWLKENVSKLSEGQQSLFKTLYASRGKEPSSLDIDTVVDQMPEEKLSLAMDQVERTIGKNKRQRGFTLVEFMIVVALLGLFTFIAVVFVAGNNPEKTERAGRDVLPGTVQVVCIEGYEYLYVESMYHSAMAPKFDKEGRPAKCRAER